MQQPFNYNNYVNNTAPVSRLPPFMAIDFGRCEEYLHSTLCRLLHQSANLEQNGNNPRISHFLLPFQPHDSLLLLHGKGSHQEWIVFIFIFIRIIIEQQYIAMSEQDKEKSHEPTLPKSKNPFLLRFAQQQRPHRTMSLNRLNYEENLRRDGTYVAKKDLVEHELFDHHLVQNNMRLQGHLKRLHATFIHEKVSQFYAYHFMNRLIHASAEKLEDNVLKETEELKGKRSFFHTIQNSIKAREGCMKQLRRCLDNLFNNQDDNVTHHVFREEIVHYRKLTGFVINHIRDWRLHLNAISAEIQYTSYIFKGEDYLITLLNDCEWMFNSFLSKFLKFSFKNDPFIMRPHVDGRGEEKYLQLFKLDEEQKGRYMIDLNYLAEERAKYLSSKVHSREEKIKDIEKIYHYKENPLSSRIFIRKLPLQKQEQADPKKETFINNFMSEEKKMRESEFTKKSDKIKKIKEIFGRTSDSGVKTLINARKFETLSQFKDPNPYEKKKIQTQFKVKKEDSFEPMNFESDFENLVRNKEVRYIKDNITPSKTQKSFKSIKINDSISQSRKFIAKDEGVDELEKVLAQLDSFSPQKLDNFKLSRKNDEVHSPIIKLNEGKAAKSRVIQGKKTMLEHNEEVYVNVRNQVIEEMEKNLSEKNLLEQRRREENDKIQNILEKKLNEESLKILKNQRQKALEGKRQLAEEFNSADKFGFRDEKLQNSKKLTQLEEELKRQMQLKWLREVQSELKRKTQLSAMEKEQEKKEENLRKEVGRVEKKKEQEERFEIIEREERARAMKKKMELDEERKREIEQEMRGIIEREKEKMEEFAAIQRMELEEEMKEAMKQKILDDIRKQKDKYYQESKHEQQHKKLEHQFRNEVREKIQEEYKVGQIMKKNRDQEQRMARLRLVKEKLGEYDQHIQKKEENKAIKKTERDLEKEKEELKSRITQFPQFKQNFNKNPRGNESDKKKLREQFELELFSFNKFNEEQGEENAKPEDYEEGLTFPIKNFKEAIDKKVEEIEQEPIQGEQVQQKKEEEKLEKIEELKKSGRTFFDKQSHTDKFTRFSQEQKVVEEKGEEESDSHEQDEKMRLKLGMTFEQYKIYKKKKEMITRNRDLDEEREKKRVQKEKKKVKKVIEDFEKMSDLNSKKDPHQDNAVEFNNLEEQVFDVASKKSQQDLKMEQIDQMQRKRKEKEIQAAKRKEQERQKANMKKKQKPKVQELDRITINSRIQSITEKHFYTEDEEDSFADESPKKSKFSPKKAMKKNKNKKVFEEKKIQKIIEQEPMKKQDLKTFIKKRQIPLSSMKSFFDDHFDHLPKVIKKINIYKREELQKFILEHQSFTILEYIKDSASVGQGVVMLNENKTKYRSMSIVHLGTYDEEDYLECLLTITKYVFRNDPCEEVVLANIYEKEVDEQWKFTKNLEGKFDPYGAIFQKKIFNTQFERKYVMRRNIGQKCLIQTIQKNNRGAFQLRTDFFITEEKRQILDADYYAPTGPKISYSGLLAHYISSHCTEEGLSQLIISSTDKAATFSQKALANIAKLSLAMKRNQGFQRLVELHEEHFQDIISLNLELINKNLAVVPYPPEEVETPTQTSWLSYLVDLTLCYDSYSMIPKIKINEEESSEPDEYLSKYLRFTPNKKNKAFILTSNAYSTKFIVLPCKSLKYKIFIADSEEYDKLRRKENHGRTTNAFEQEEKEKIDLGIYLKVFFANVEKHEQSQYENIWIPEISVKAQKNSLEGLDVLTDNQSSGVSRGSLDFTYLEYLGNSLIIEPTHKDLLVTPPFILGIMNMQIETVMEGSPVWVQRIDKSDIKYLKEVEKVKKESD